MRLVWQDPTTGSWFQVAAKGIKVERTLWTGAIPPTEPDVMIMGEAPTAARIAAARKAAVEAAATAAGAPAPAAGAEQAPPEPEPPEAPPSPTPPRPTPTNPTPTPTSTNRKAPMNTPNDLLSRAQAREQEDRQRAAYALVTDNLPTIWDELKSDLLGVLLAYGFKYVLTNWPLRLKPEDLTLLRSFSESYTIDLTLDASKKLERAMSPLLVRLIAGLRG